MRKSLLFFVVILGTSACLPKSNFGSKRSPFLPKDSTDDSIVAGVVDDEGVVGSAQSQEATSASTAQQNNTQSNTTTPAATSGQQSNQQAGAQQTTNQSTQQTSTNSTAQKPSCSANQVYSSRHNQCFSLPTQEFVGYSNISQDAPPHADTSDNYAYNTKGAASLANGGRSVDRWGILFKDKQITTDNITITSSVALAGAIASVRYKGFELIASGGHGSAMQFISHDWDSGSGPTECRNPTEGGNMNDDGGAFPHHGPSSSWIDTIWQDSNTISTYTSLVDYVPPGKTGLNYGNGSCTNTNNV